MLMPASGLEIHAVKHKTRHTPQQNRQPQQKSKSSYHANSQYTSTENTNTTKQNAPLLGRSAGNVENPIILKACANQVRRQDHVNKEHELCLMNLMTKTILL
jgi:biotin carboxyl carrier protein